MQFFGLQGSYKLLDALPAHLPAALDRLIEEGYCGFNVTIPHKEAMFKLARSHTPEAATAGAANTIKVVPDSAEFTAHNTDIAGCERALETALQGGKTNGRACVVGAGGAARAALIALKKLGFDRTIVIAREPGKAHEALSRAGLAIDIELQALPQAPMNIEAISLIVQTTPIGQGSNEIPAWMENVVTQIDPASNLLFFDMVYARNNQETPLVQFAKDRGWQAIDGTNMLVHQACLAFEFWTGKLPPFDLMKAALDAARHVPTGE